MNRRYLSLALVLVLGCAMGAALLFGPAGAPLALANNSYHTLPYGLVWQASYVVAENDWSGADAILGYTGADADITATTRGAQYDPRQILDDFTTGKNPLVHANELDMSASVASTYSVIEFHPTTGGLTKAMIALHANSKFDAPFLMYHINTTGKTNVQIQYDVVDINSGATDATQEVALHYRIGNSGAWTNIVAGYISDATAATDQPKRVTHISAALPAAAWGQGTVQFRVLTANANGSDEFIAVDNVSVTGTNAAGPTPTNTVVPPTATNTGVPPTSAPPTPNPALNIKQYIPIVVH